MLNILLHAHSGLRWIILLLLISAVFKSLIKWRSNAPYTEGDRKLNFFTMLSTHIQLLLGLVLYFISDKVVFSGDAMKVPASRFFTVEHNLLMLIAILLITMGYTRSKKMPEDARKYRLTLIYFTVALIIILIGIPWPFRGFGSGWF